MDVVATFADARKRSEGVVGLVPTMGYLHEGHLSHVAAARADCDTVVMSLFVNPLQFAEGEDFETYPRDTARDAGLAGAAGVDILFAPEGTEMYAGDPVTRVTVGRFADTLEGSARPGHFEGVATAVAKLFAGLQPHRAYFGRKDAQQLVIVTRMAGELSFPVKVIGGSTVREPDGLALSSRNTYLTERQRSAARALSRGLMRAADEFEGGVRSAEMLEAAARAELDSESLVKPEYVAVVDRDDLSRPEAVAGDAFLAVAARVGPVRLIDNVHFDIDDEGKLTVDRGVRLSFPSSVAAGREP